MFLQTQIFNKRLLRVKILEIYLTFTRTYADAKLMFIHMPKLQRYGMTDLPFDCYQKKRNSWHYLYYLATKQQEDFLYYGLLIRPIHGNFRIATQIWKKKSLHFPCMYTHKKRKKNWQIKKKCYNCGHFLFMKVKETSISTT